MREEEEEEETVGSCLQHQDLFPNEKEKRREGKIFSAEEGKEESGKLFLGRLLRDELMVSSLRVSRQEDGRVKIDERGLLSHLWGNAEKFTERMFGAAFLRRGSLSNLANLWRQGFQLCEQL